jgi:predicted ribosome quality control (RQC) complex YloA/Tae2 family protein
MKRARHGHRNPRKKKRIKGKKNRKEKEEEYPSESGFVVQTLRYEKQNDN